MIVYCLAHIYVVYIYICSHIVQIKRLHLQAKMASLLLTVSLLFAAFSYPLVEAAYYSNSYYTTPKPLLNPIDSCWRRNPNWASNRRALADCAVGFGKAAIGGKYGSVYVVTNPSDNPENPRPGTLRHAVIQSKPLWITFARDMVIRLRTELEVKSHKTIDGRGVKVDIGNGPCISIKRASNVIIHGITVHDCRLSKGFDGDGIRVFQSRNVWIDHCHLSRCQDGLIDVVTSSTAVTISNNRLINHQKVSIYTPFYMKL